MNLPTLPFTRPVVARRLAAAWMTQFTASRGTVARLWLITLACGHSKRVRATGQVVPARREAVCEKCAKGRRVQWMRGWDNARADEAAGKVDAAYPFVTGDGE